MPGIADKHITCVSNPGVPYQEGATIVFNITVDVYAADANCAAAAPSAPEFIGPLSGTRILNVVAGARVELNGLTLRDASDVDGGIAWVFDGRLRLGDVRVAGGSASMRGGCIYVANDVNVARLLLFGDTTVDDCHAVVSGGGVHIQQSPQGPLAIRPNPIDPLFTVPAGRSAFVPDAALSPAVNACPNGAITDIDGVLRPVGLWDVGVFEQ